MSLNKGKNGDQKGGAWNSAIDEVDDLMDGEGGAWHSPTMAKHLIIVYNINGSGDNEYLKLSSDNIDDILDELQENNEELLHEGGFEEEREQRDEIKELYSRNYDDKVESDPKFKKIFKFRPIKSLSKKYPSGSSLFPEGIKKTFMNHWFAFKSFGLTMNKLSTMDNDGYLQDIGLTEGQSVSVFETIKLYHKNEKQKANQGLAAAKGIGETQRMGFARNEEGLTEMIAAELKKLPYNEGVAKRMKTDKLTGEFLKGIGKQSNQERADNLTAEFLDDIGEYGQARKKKKKKTKGKKKKTKGKKKQTKMKKKKTKVIV